MSNFLFLLLLPNLVTAVVVVMLLVLTTISMFNATLFARLVPMLHAWVKLLKAMSRL